MELDVKTLPALRLAVVRHSGPYNQIGPAFHALGAAAGPAGLFAHPDAMMMGIYHDDPATTPPDRLRSAAAIAIGETTAVPTGLDEERVPAGRFACYLHVGPYEQLPDAWKRVKGDLLPESGHRLRTAASYEIYRNNPAQVLPAELQTEICVPIE